MQYFHCKADICLPDKESAYFMKHERLSQH
jgi:hypothetical protein